VSTTEWEDRGEDVEQVDPAEVDDVPPGTVDEDAEAGLGIGTAGEPGQWTEGGGTLPPEGEEGIGGSPESPRRDEESF
jgi:hypothetical protein